MPELADQIEAARAELAHLERRALGATCAELGHDMVSIGGCNCGCLFKDDEGHALPGQCSVPVHRCTRCKDCDYGENDEARQIRRDCHERFGAPPGGAR